MGLQLYATTTITTTTHDTANTKDLPEGVPQVAQRTITKSRQVDGQPNGPIRDHPIGTHIPANASCPCSKEPSSGRDQPNSSNRQGTNPNKPQLTIPEGTDTGAVSISTREDGRNRRLSATPALEMNILQEW